MLLSSLLVDLGEALASSADIRDAKSIVADGVFFRGTLTGVGFV